MSAQFDTSGEAIVAALDELEPGGTLTVHGEGCAAGWDVCTCTPETWHYPED